MTDQNRFRLTLTCISLVAGVVGATAWVAMFCREVCHLPVSLEFWRWLEPSVLRALRIHLLPINVDAVSRAFATFTNPNIFAEYSAIALPLVVYASFSGPRTRQQLLCRVCLISLVIGGLCSLSRAFMVALILLIALYCIAYIKKSWAILLVILPSYWLIPNRVIERFLSISTTDSSINERFQIWEAGLEEIGASPVFGIGAGVENSWALLLSHGIDAPHMHDLPLQLMVEGGIVALFLVLLIGWRALRQSLDLLMHRRSLGVVFIAFLAAFACISMVEFPFMTPKLVAQFLMTLALADACMPLFLKSPATPLHHYAQWFGSLKDHRTK